MATMLRFCLVLDIKGFLMNHTRLAQYKGMFRDDDGRYMSPLEAKRRLLDELSQGHLFLPFCKHQPFDYVTGECAGENSAVVVGEGG